MGMNEVKIVSTERARTHARTLTFYRVLRYVFLEKYVFSYDAFASSSSFPTHHSPTHSFHLELILHRIKFSSKTCIFVVFLNWDGLIMLIFDSCQFIPSISWWFSFRVILFSLQHLLVCVCCKVHVLFFFYFFFFFCSVHSCVCTYACAYIFAHSVCSHPFS